MSLKNLTRLLLFAAAIDIIFILGKTGLWFYQTHPASSSSLILYGNVDIRQVDLAFNASGRITQMAAAEGQQVHKGELLAQLDTDRFLQEVAEAKGRVAAQKDVLVRMHAGSRPEEIRKARADVSAAQAQLHYSQLQYKRSQVLAARDMTSKAGLDNAKAQYDMEASQLNVAQQELSLAVEGPRKEDVAAAQATLDSLIAALKLTEINLADASLYAPDDGVAQTRILEPGDMASPQLPVYTLALTNPVWVRVYVAESNLGRIHIGMRAQVSSDSYPGKKYSGWIGYISPTAEFTPQSVQTAELRSSLVYQVRVYVCNPENQLHLGMPVTVKVLLNTNATVVGTQSCRPAS